MRRIGGLLVSLVAALGLPATAAVSAPDSVLVQVGELFDSGRVAEAVPLLETALAEPRALEREVSLRGALGDAYLALAQTEKALAQFDRWVELVPESPLAHARRAGALSRRVNTVALSIAAYERSIELGNRRADVWSGLGFALRTLANSGELPEAEAKAHRREARRAFQRALEIDSDHVPALGNVADIFFNAGGHDQALAFYRRMDAVSPGEATTLSRIGSTLVEIGRYQDALEPLGQALRAAERELPDAAGARRYVLRDVLADVHLRSALAHVGMGQRELALAEIDQTLRIADCDGCATESVLHKRHAASARQLRDRLGGSVPASPAH